MPRLALPDSATPVRIGSAKILYAVTSAGATGNGSLVCRAQQTNTPFWNLGLAFVMFAGRFFTMIPMLAVAGSMAGKKLRAPSGGTFPTEGLTFAALLIGVILIVGALTFLPALALALLGEHFAMTGSQTWVTIERIVLAASALLLLSVTASKTAGRFGIPSLLVFLGIGML